MPAIIHVHHHILPNFFFRETNNAAHPVGGIAPAPWSEARALELWMTPASSIDADHVDPAPTDRRAG
jgi:hypothetical protein